MPKASKIAAARARPGQEKGGGIKYHRKMVELFEEMRREEEGG